MNKRALAPGLTLTICLVVVAANALSDYQASLTLALLVFTLSALVFSWLPSTLAATLFMLGGVAASLAPPEVIFSGFHSSALWLVFGSMLISTAMVRTGIDRRISRVFDYLPHRSYGGALLSIGAVGLVSLLIIPSAFSRVVLLIPIAHAFSRRLGFEKGDAGFSGIVAMAVCSTYLTSFSLLTTGYPNLIVAGIAESLFAVHLNYGTWMALHFPIFGVLRLAVIFLIIYFMFPARVAQPEPHSGSLDPQAPWSQEELSVVLVTVGAVLLWATDTVHGVSAGWVGMGAGLLCYARFITGEPAGKFTQAVEVGPLLLVAGLMSVGAVISHTGVSEHLSRVLANGIPFESQFGVFYTLAWTNFLTQIITTNAALPSIMLPQSEMIAIATDQRLHTVIAAHIAGWSNLPLPHLAGPTLVALHTSGIDKGKFVWLIVSLALSVSLILWPLYYLWIKMIGFI